MDRLSQIALFAAVEAVEESGIGAEIPTERAGVALGTSHGAHLSNELFWRGARGPGGASPALFAYTLPSAAAGEIAIHLGLRGPSLTLVQGRGGGLSALAQAADLVAAGTADFMLAGAADVLSLTLLRSQTESAEPVLAEGASFAVLAPRPGPAPVARFAGTGQAWGESALTEAVAAALAQAGLRSGQIRVRLGTGTGDRLLGGDMALVLGDGQAAAPLLQLCLAAAGPEFLPCLIAARDESGLAEALCLAEP
jgi:3-oxoacyl-[acyl-carrier-protein] synthase II